MTNERPPSTGVAWVGAEQPAELDPEVDTWNGQRVSATLADFLLARIAEDEAAARKLGGKRWVTDEPNGCCVLTDDERETIVEMSWDASSFIARHDPARVLAECEAKRGVVAELQRVVDHFGEMPFAAMNVLCNLARPYADHPDYREEWRP